MRELTCRPLALGCLLFFLSVCLLDAASLPCRLLCGAVSLAATVIVILLSLLPVRKRLSPVLRRTVLVSAAALFAATLLSHLTVDVRYRRDTAPAGADADLTGTITEVLHTSSYSGLYKLRTDTVNGEWRALTLLLETGSPDLTAGDTIRCAASLSEFPETENGFPLRRYYQSRGITLQATALTEPKRTGTVTSPRLFFLSLNRRLSGIFASRLPTEEAGFLSALLLGNRSGLPDTVSRDFRRLGLSHLLALSGMHLSALTAAGDWLLRKLHLRRALRRGILLLPVTAFLFLTGFPLSLVRAAVMLLLYALLPLFSGQEDSLTALGCAAALIVLVNPLSALDVGLQLSVAAMLGCILSGYLLPRRTTVPSAGSRAVFRRCLVKTRDVFLTSLYVLLFILPLSSLYFGSFSLTAPLMNVLLTPVVLLLLLCAPFLLLLSFTPAATAAAAVMRWLTHTVLQAVSYLAAHVGTAVSLHYTLAPAAICLLFTALLLLPFVTKRGRKRCLALVLSAVLLFGGNAALMAAFDGTRVSVTLTTHGKSDALLVLSDSKSLLCDCSDGSMTALEGALGALDASTCTDLDVLLLTHYHQRHVATVRKLCSVRFVGALWLPEPQTETEAALCSRLTETAEELGTAVAVYQRDASPVFGKTEWTFTTRGWLSRSTHPVLSFSVSAFGETVVYLGASATEGALSGTADALTACADHLLFGRHGPVSKLTPTPALPLAAVFYVLGDALLPESLPAEALTVREDAPVIIYLRQPSFSR